jgi:hypothetical protein
MEGDNLSLRGDNSEKVNFKNLLLQNQQPKINQTWYELSFGEDNSSLFK